MHYLFVPSLLAAFSLVPLSVIAALCNAKNQPVFAGGWYEGWASAKIPPSAIPFDKLNFISFAFALVSFYFSITSLLI